MTTLADLRALALAAGRMPIRLDEWKVASDALCDALTPDVVLALLDVAEAAELDPGMWEVVDRLSAVMEPRPVEEPE